MTYDEEPEPIVLRGCWHAVEDELPPINQRVVCSDGHRYWLDMRTEYMPELSWGSHKAVVWWPFENLSLALHLGEKERAKRMRAEPDVVF